MIKIKDTVKEVIDDIPIFCEKNEYIANYEKISKDHLDHLEAHGTSPFMDEESWDQLDETTLEIINKYAKSGDNVLDAGVGLGRLLKKMSKSVKKFGVDISLNYLKKVKDNEIEVYCALLENLPFEDEQFDVVISTDVLEHVLNLNESIEEIKRVLKKGGYFIFRVPFDEDLSSYLEYKDYDFVHLRSFRISETVLQFEKIFKMEFIEMKKDGFIAIENKLKSNPSVNHTFMGKLANYLNILDTATICKKSYTNFIQSLLKNGVITNYNYIHKLNRLIFYIYTGIFKNRKVNWKLYYDEMEVNFVFRKH